MFSWWSKIPRIRNNVNMFTTLTLYPIVTVTGQRFRHQRSSLLLLALGYRPNKNRKTPPELELKAGHTVVTTSQSRSTTSRSGILDSGNAHTLPATGHGRGVSPKLHSDWFGAMAAGFSQKTQKERIWMYKIAKKRWWTNYERRGKCGETCRVVIRDGLANIGYCQTSQDLLETFSDGIDRTFSRKCLDIINLKQPEWIA